MAKPASGTALDTNHALYTNLLAVWGMLENTGTTSADSKGSNTLTLSGVSWSTDANGDPCLSATTAQSNPVSLASLITLLGTSSWSVAWRAKQTNSDNQGMVLGHPSDPSSNNFIWFIGGTGLRYRNSIGTDKNFNGVTTFTTEADYVLTYDDTNSIVRFYKDGTEVNSPGISTAAHGGTLLIDGLMQGNASSALSLIGKMSYVYLWTSRVLTPTEAGTLHTTPYIIFVGAGSVGTPGGSGALVAVGSTPFQGVGALSGSGGLSSVPPTTTEVFVFFGDSNCNGRLTSNQTFTPSGGFTGQKLNSAGALSALADPTAAFSSAGLGSLWPIVMTQWMAGQLKNCKILNAGVGSTGITQWYKGSGAGLYEQMATALSGAGITAVTAFIGVIGSVDAFNGSTNLNTMKTALNHFVTDVAADYPGSKVIIMQTMNVNAALRADIDNVREAIRESNVSVGGTFHDIQNDNLHFTTDAEALTAATRIYQAMREILYGAATYSGIGPVMSSVTLDITRTIVTVTYNISATPILPASSIAGYRVLAAGSVVTAASIASSGNAQHVLTFSSPLAGPVLVSLASNADGYQVAVPTDSSTNHLPAQPFMAQEAVLSPSVGVLTGIGAESGVGSATWLSVGALSGIANLLALNLNSGGDVNTAMLTYLRGIYGVTGGDLTTLLMRRMNELTGDMTARLKKIIKDSGAAN